jgi:hypothetical protein
MRISGQMASRQRPNPSTFTTGDRVAYSREFLANTGQYTGWAPFARGEVASFVTLSKNYILAVVRWDDGTSSNVLRANLVHEQRIPFEPG